MPYSPLQDGAGYVNSINPFINSLFDKSVRSAQTVINAAGGGATTVSFTDDHSRKLILESWLAAWMTYAGVTPIEYAAYIRPADQAIISFLAGYIKKSKMSLCERSLALSSTSINPDSRGVPFYENSGYTRKRFLYDDGTWAFGSFDASGQPNGDGTVARFLWLLFHGAHMVVITNSGDGADDVKAFDTSFTNNFTSSQISVCPGNSHYGGSYGGDHYYLDVEDEPPANPSFILALLVGNTSAANSNGFMQLEGWPAQAGTDTHGGPRHSFDWDIYQGTVWNVSTFGACAYSEKRSSTVFLAQDTFSLHIDPNTHMPLYDGAGSVQDWMLPGFLTGGPISEVLYDVHDDVGDLYFFQGTQLIHYDPSEKKMHDNYPQPIENLFPGLAVHGFDAIDAAYGVPPGHGDNAGTYYFFKGDQYIHYDPSKPKDQRIRSQHTITGDDASEPGHWPGLKEAGFTTIDAAVYVPSADGKSDKILFFHGPRVFRFDVKSNSGTVSPPLIVPKGFSGTLGIDGAEMWSTEANRLLIFMKNEVAVFDLAKDILDPAYGYNHIYGKTMFPGLWWWS